MNKILHLFGKHLLWFLLATYAIAAVLPGPGLWLRERSIGRASFAGDTMKLSAPALMLAFLLFNAGFGVRLTELRHMVRRPWPLICGLFANLAVPLTFIGLMSLIMRSWHNNDEVQNILVGLALIASMPIAGSSTAWAQNSNGNLALSLGMVLISTLLSPLTTPIILRSVGVLTIGDYSEDLVELASGGTNLFLALCVIVPSLLGIVCRLSIGEAKARSIKPWLKLVNICNLLILSYSNAAVSLPKAIHHPDLDFLTVILIITSILCVSAFGSGWIISKLLKSPHDERTSLMYGLGMNNNGTGLVLASMSLADHPAVMLPLICYNLVQQIAAGIVSDWQARSGLSLEAESAAKPTPLLVRSGEA